MSNLDPLLKRNRSFAQSGAHYGITVIPNHHLFVITCMDPRVDPAHILGIELGDAIVLRNAGGRVTDDVIRDIAFIAAVTERTLGDDAPVFEVAILHHTECGTGFLANDDFRHSFADRIGAAEEELARHAVIDPIQSVLVDVEMLLASPLLPSRVFVSGHVYDVATGLVTTAAAPIGTAG
jgi:carbonic anhydrase